MSSDCECPLHNTPHIATTLPDPKTPTDILIVGDSPSPVEINTNSFLPGDSCALLQKAIKDASGGKWTQLRFASTHAVLCLQNSGKTKQYLSACAASCRGRLLHVMQTVQPKLIMALGNTALRTLMNDESLKITHCIGRVMIQPETQIPVVPVLHPAAVRHQPASFKDFEVGVVLAIQTALETPTQTPLLKKSPGVTKWHVISSIADAKKAAMRLYELAFKQCQATSIPYPMSCDIETTGLKPHSGDTTMQVGISWKPNHTLLFSTSDTWVALHPLFKTRKIAWVFQNGKFDCQFLRRVGLPARVDEDVMLLHYLLDEHRGTHGLKTLATRLLGADEYAAELSPYLGKKDEYDFRKIPPDVLNEYHAKDCDYTLQLYHLLKPQVEQDTQLYNVYRQILLPASELLIHVESRGIHINADCKETLRITLQQAKDDVTNEIQYLVQDCWDPNVFAAQLGKKQIPQVFNPSSHEQLHWVLYNRLNLTTPSGVPRTTNKDSLERLQPFGHPLIQAILKHRSVSKLLSTYVVGLNKHINASGDVHSSYLLHGTVTGRLSSREPNLQNIPRESSIKSLFCARPGYIFLEVDYSSAELRTLAYLSRDKTLIQIFKEGRDLHDEMAEVLFGKGYTYEDRVKAKMVNFGIAYGRTGFSIAQQFKIPPAEGERMVRMWFARFPEAHRYITSCRDAVTRGEAIVTPFGRKRRFGLTTQRTLHEQQNEAANFPISSTASDLTLLSACTLRPLLAAHDAHIVNMIHDSLLIECPQQQEVVLEVARLTRLAMVSMPVQVLVDGGRVPFSVDVECGPSWGDMHELSEL